MKHQAIVFLYIGEHPSQEAIQRTAEALVNSVQCDPTSLRNINMDEDSIAAALIAAGLQNRITFAESKENDDYLTVVCKGIAEMISYEKAKASSNRELLLSLKKRYINALKTGGDHYYISGVNAMYNSGDKIGCVERLTKELNIPESLTKVIVNSLFGVAELCQGLTEE